VKALFGGRRGGSETESGIKSEINIAKIVELIDAGTRRGAVK
jgi:hypothetical protein